MNHNESGVSEIISTILAIILVIALAAIIGSGPVITRSSGITENT